MKNTLKAILFLFLLFWSFYTTNAFTLRDIFETNSPWVEYCQNWECWLEEWIEEMYDIDGIETDRKASDFVQDIVSYLLTFVTIIWVIYIIYAWFNLLTSAWDEEKAKKSKQIIIYVMIWIILMYLANSIIGLIMEFFK